MDVAPRWLVVVEASEQCETLQLAHAITSILQAVLAQLTALSTPPIPPQWLALAVSYLCPRITALQWATACLQPVQL
jgi:hypothetical protein